MNDLILRSALLEAMPKNDEIFSSEVRRVICKAPAVDAVEVVRCKDCIHFNHAVIDDEPAETFEVDVCLHKELFPTRVTPDFYCAHGAKMNAEVQDVPQD